MKILGNLVTAKGPHRKVVVAVATLEPSGKLRAAPEHGVTDGHGAFEFEVSIPEGSALPRMFLRIRRGVQWVIVADAPRQQTANRVEFGEVLVTSKRVRKSGGRPVFGVLPSEETERSALLASIASQKAKLDAAASQRAALEKQVLAKDKELSGLRTSVENATASLTSKDAELAALAAEIERLTSVTTPPPPVPPKATFSSLVSAVGNQLGEARKSLAVHGSGLRLGNVKVDLQVLASQDGNELRFPTQGDDGLVGATTKIGLEFNGSGELAEAASEQAVVPDVSGTTLLFATRRLKDVGLAVSPSYLVVSDPSQRGRVVGQIPAASETMALGEQVELLIGKTAHPPANG